MSELRDKRTPRLTTAQRDMLRAFGGYDYGEGHVRPAGRRTADALVRRGLLRRRLEHWYAITDAGRTLLPSARR
jgi:hypothetical protein